MMNFRKVFLMSSVCIAGNIFCAEQGGLLPSKQAELPAKLETVSLAGDTDNRTAAESSTSSEVSPAGTQASVKGSTSSVFTRGYYGVAKHIGGKTAFATFMELYEQGTLKADYEENPNDPINRFNEAVTERFTKKDLLAMDKQEKINKLFASAHKIDNEFVLAKALASTYLIMQQGAVKEILDKQALVIEPQLKKERDDAIAKAHNEYNSAVSQELQHASKATANFRYLYKHALAKGEITNEQKGHYESSEKFLALLESIRKSKQSESK